MMVLVGTNDSHLINGEIKNVSCPKCEILTNMNYSIYIRYTHITMIPLFPVGKVIFIKCVNCKENIEFNDLSEEFKTEIIKQKEKFNLKTPIWTFTGITVFIAVAVFWGYSYLLSIGETKKFIQNPKPGDIYKVKFSNGYYSNMRIDKVSNDSLFLTHNDYNAYLPNEVEELDKPENYGNNKVSYSKNEILTLYQQNKIFSITRNK